MSAHSCGTCGRIEPCSSECAIGESWEWEPQRWWYRYYVAWQYLCVIWRVLTERGHGWGWHL